MCEIKALNLIFLNTEPTSFVGNQNVFRFDGEFRLLTVVLNSFPMSELIFLVVRCRFPYKVGVFYRKCFGIQVDPSGRSVPSKMFPRFEDVLV